MILTVGHPPLCAIGHCPDALRRDAILDQSSANDLRPCSRQRLEVRSRPRFIRMTFNYCGAIRVPLQPLRLLRQCLPRARSQIGATFREKHEITSCRAKVILSRL